MRVLFKSQHLERLFRNSELAARSFGEGVGRAFIFAVNIMLCAPRREVLAELRQLDYQASDGEAFAIELGSNQWLFCTHEGDQITVVSVGEANDD